jgi:hypothetical protein
MPTGRVEEGFLISG